MGKQDKITNFKSLLLGDVFILTENHCTIFGDNEFITIALLASAFNPKYTIDGFRVGKSKEHRPLTYFVALNIRIDESLYGKVKIEYIENENCLELDVASSELPNRFRITNDDILRLYTMSDMVNIEFMELVYLNLGSADIPDINVIRIGRLRDLSTWPVEALEFWARDHLRLKKHHYPDDLISASSTIRKRIWIVEMIRSKMMLEGCGRKNPDIQKLGAKEDGIVIPEDGMATSFLSQKIQRPRDCEITSMSDDSSLVYVRWNQPPIHVPQNGDGATVCNQETTSALDGSYDDNGE
jgi:hypothetical protein